MQRIGKRSYYMEVLSNVKIVIIGNPSVGKTSLRRTYIGEKFRTNYIETIGSDFSFKEVKIGDRTMGLALWDLAGQDRFLSVHPLFYKGSYGCVVVYSVIDRATFEKVEEWIERFISSSNRDKLPLMIIGNKIDAIDKYDDVISLEEHCEFVEEMKVKYPDHTITEFRTSALTGENVEDGFTKFGELVYNWIQGNTKAEQLETKYEDSIDKNIPGAYAMVMNQIQGPQIVSTNPMIPLGGEIEGKISNGAVKLIASLDFNDIIAQSSIISSYPWVEPKGTFYYIAFVLDNPNARGSKELFLLGVNVIRELEDTVAGIKGVLDGFLHSSINEFARIIIESDIDLVTQSTYLKDHKELRIKVSDLLYDLREKTNESIKRWYNIPS